MKLIITRHGETHQNVSKISMGQKIQGDLNKTGIAQAHQLANRLSSEPIDIIHTSDLGRAVETTNIVAKHHTHIPIINQPLLRERNLGIYEGGPSSAWKQAMRHSTLPFTAYQPQDGESYTMLQQRVNTYLDKLFTEYEESNNTVAIISHTATVTIMLLTLFKQPITKATYERLKPENTAISILNITKDHVETVLLNSIDHLSAHQKTAPLKRRPFDAEIIQQVTR
jgi:phosphoserine phosphatase